MNMFMRPYRVTVNSLNNKLMKSQETLVNEAKRLQYELTIVNDINKKLSEELRIYQKKYNIAPKKYAIKTDELGFTNLAQFMQQLFYIEPLLLAYQNKIGKLQETLGQSQNRAGSFEQKAYQLTSQNDFLREELQQKCKIILQRESALTGIDVKYLKLENQGLKQKQKLIKEENEGFKKQIMKLKDQVENLEKQQQKEARVKGYQVEIDRLKQKQRQLVIQNLALNKQHELLKTKYKNQTTLAEKNNQTLIQLQASLSKYQNQNKILTKKIQTLNDTHYHTITQLESQNQSLKSQLKQTQRHEANLFQKNLSIENQIQGRQHQVHNLQLKATTLQSNNNNLLQMIESYEGKLAQLQKKLKISEDNSKQQGLKMKELLKQRDILSWKLDQSEQRSRRKQEQVKQQRSRLSKTQNQKLQIWRKNKEVEQDRVEQQLANTKLQYTNLQDKYARATKDRSGFDIS